MEEHIDDTSPTSFNVKDYSTVNFSCANDLIGEWISIANQFSASHVKASSDSTFKILSSLGLCGDFPERFDRAFDTLVSNVNSIANGAKGYIDELEAEDTAMEEQFPIPKTETDINNYVTSKGSNYSNLGSSYNYSGGGGSENQDSPQILQADYALPDNTNAQLDFFNHISLNDLIQIINILNNLANQRNVTIDQLLDDEEMGTILKNILSNSPDLSEEYRKIINEGSSISLIKTLKSIINGEVKGVFGLDEQDTLLTVKEYLTAVAKNNNMELNELLNNQQNKSILLDCMSNFSNINSVLKNVTQENAQDIFRQIYDGENLNQLNCDENTQKIIRTQIDVKSSLENISYEDLLLKSNYSQEVFDSAERLNRVGIFASSLLNNSNIGSILSNLLK